MKSHLNDLENRVDLRFTEMEQQIVLDEPSSMSDTIGAPVVIPSFSLSLFGIVIDNANQRVQVLARRATLHRYGDTPLHWTAPDTYLTYEDMGAVGDHLITMELDPDVASTASFVIYDSDDADPKPVRARLYTVTLTQVSAGPPVVYAAVLKPPIHGMGDINIIPLFGDHPVEEDLGS